MRCRWTTQISVQPIKQFVIFGMPLDPRGRPSAIINFISVAQVIHLSYLLYTYYEYHKHQLFQLADCLKPTT